MKIRPEQMEVLQTRMQADTPRRIREDLHDRNIAAQQDVSTGDLRVADGRGFVTRLHFDGRGLPERVTLPSRREFKFEQDGQGRLAALVYPGGQRVEMARDANGLVTRLTRPGLLNYQFRYDGQERLTAVVDPYARVTTLDYSAGGNLASLTDRAGGKMIWERDAQGKLLAIQDALGKRVVYESDEEGRLSGVQFPDGSREEYGFYEEENIVEIVQRNGESVLTYFDADGAAEEIAWADGGWLLPTFGEEGRVVGLQNEDANLRFAYDDAGNVLAETGEHGTVGYAYDADGRLIALETPWGDRVEYAYDDDGRVSGVVDWEGRVVALTYAPDGTLETIRRPNGLTETHHYAQVGRLEQAEVVNEAGRIVSRQNYSYDLRERLTGVTDQSGTGTATRESLRMEYDAEGRLLTESSGATGVPLAVYGYDVKGNMIACNRLPVPVGRMDEPQAFGGESIRYDANGNMTQLPDGAGGTLRCRFANNGALREVETYPLAGYNQTNQNQTWEYEYDGLSRRTAKTNGVTTWRYGWAQHQLLWEEVQETPDALPIRRDYLWLPDSVTPIAFRENGRAFWLQADARDAIIRVFDEAGNVAWSARYDSFGQAEVLVNRVRQAWRLPGQYADEETGLHYNLARYYSPHIKSYLSRDPQWHQFGASNYSYCLNDPWNRADPFGTISHVVAVGSNIAVSVAVQAAVTPVAVAAGSTVGGYVGGAIGAALGGPVGAFVGVLAGRVIGGFLGKMAAAGLGAFAGALAQQEMETGKVCIPCALKEAGIAALLTGALMGVGKIPVVKRLAGKSLAFLKSKFLPDRIFNPATNPGPLMLARKKAIEKLAKLGNANPSEIDIHRARLDTISTFRSGTYTRKVLQDDTLFYRTHGGNAGETGAFWSRTPPQGKMQNTMDSAILDAWGNTQQKLSVMKVPAGTVIYEGPTAMQADGVQTLLGGGNQVLFQGGANSDWLVRP